MKRTISIKLQPTPDQADSLLKVQQAFAEACNKIVPYAVNNRCWNRVALHHLAYYPTREATNLGSQMTCGAIHAVCMAYKVLKINRTQEVPAITFKPSTSVHYDKRTYSFTDDSLSLYTLGGRVKVKMVLGDFQADYLAKGTPKEAELIRKGKRWFFNLVLDLADVDTPGGSALGVDMGENNIASTSSGKIFKGSKLRHDRDKYLALRARVQSNGSISAKQLLRKLSGKEQRHVKHVNHVVSKQVVAEAIRTNAGVIVLEKLTNIRKRIRAGKRVRSRLHRWAWYQLQEFIRYKAEARGIRVEYVNPAYTSQTCAVCGSLASRTKHKLSCPTCGNLTHADLNAGLNIARLAVSIGAATGVVNRPNVAHACV